MSLDLFENIIKQVSSLTDMVTFHLMGEPLAHPDFERFVFLCKKYQTKIFLVTNGYLLKDKFFELICDPIFHQVNFSLHSFFDNYPEKSADKYLQTIFNWTHLALQKNPSLYINYRLWNLNETKGKDSKNLKMLESIESEFQIDLKKNLNIKKNKSLPVKGRLYLHYDTEFTWPSLDLPVLGEKGTCYGLQSHFGIHADGTVVPCCLDKEADIALGDANTESIESILSSPKAQSIYDGFKKHQLKEELCKRCQYITRFTGA